MDSVGEGEGDFKVLGQSKSTPLEATAEGALYHLSRECVCVNKKSSSGPAVSSGWLQKGAYTVPTPFSVMTRCLSRGCTGGSPSSHWVFRAGLIAQTSVNSKKQQGDPFPK